MIELKNYTIPQLTRLRFLHSVKTHGIKRKKICKDCDITIEEYSELLEQTNPRKKRYGGDSSEES